MFTYTFRLVICLTLICETESSCKKFLDIHAPAVSLTGEQAFASNSNATAAIIGIYSRLAGPGGSETFSNYYTSYYGAMLADEGRPYAQSMSTDPFAMNAILVDNSDVNAVWRDAYQNIYECNLAMERLPVSSGVSDSLRRQLTGEVYFLRAFNYFYLTNFFGDVPLVLKSDYRAASVTPRSAVKVVYIQMIADLLMADSLLTDTYPGADKIRVNRLAAKALLARVYLYAEDWTNAASIAGDVILSSLFQLEPSLNHVFLINNREAIWQLPPSYPGFTSSEGVYWIYSVVTNHLQPNLIAASALLGSFEPGDLRKDRWLMPYNYQDSNYFLPAKYKEGYAPPPSTPVETATVLRLGEQYLIRSEARVHLQQFASAAEDVSMLRVRAGLQPLNTFTGEQEGLLAVERERRIELMFEWGHRWFDLRRTGRADAVLANEKVGWKPTDVLFPIPKSQLDANVSLTQNPGY